MRFINQYFAVDTERKLAIPASRMTEVRFDDVTEMRKQIRRISRGLKHETFIVVSHQVAIDPNTFYEPN